MECEIYVGTSCSQTDGVNSKINLISYDKIGTKYIIIISYTKFCKIMQNSYAAV